MTEVTSGGLGIKWVQGESENIIYVLSVDQVDQLFITKFDIDNSIEIWTDSTGSNDGSVVQAMDIAYNETDGYITVTGFHEDVANETSKIFVTVVNESGEFLADFVRDSEIPGKNAGLTVHADQNSGLTLIGGTIMKEGEKLDAFTWYLTGSDFENGIVGKVFFDENENGILDANESGSALGSITIEGAYAVYTNSDGIFKSIVDPGWYNVSYNLPDGWMLTTDSASFTAQTGSLLAPLDTLCFGIAPISADPQVEVFMYSQAFVCNEPLPMTVHVKNTGTTAEDVYLHLDHAGSLSTYPIPSPDSISNDTIFWSFLDLQPGVSRFIDLNFTMPSADFIGETQSFIADVGILDVNDQTVSDWNTTSLEDILLCSYDPNDKLVTPTGIGEDGLTLFDQPLQYTIRFQNTGNYPARDIVIRDTLDSDLDTESFEFLASSHPVTEIRREANVLSFTFENIYLPDSVSNEPASHGFVSFRISPLPGLPENTDINNSAGIYFDLNPPIITNTTQNQLVSELPTSVSKPIIDVPTVVIYPNPANDHFTVEAMNPGLIDKPWRLFDSLGRVIESGTLKSEKSKVFTRHYPPGFYFYELDNHLFKVVVFKE